MQPSGRQESRAADTLPPSSGRRGDRISGTTGFAAAIDGASIADLVQLECLRGLTRAIRVFSEGHAGVLYFDQGQLVHADTGDQVGEEAALSILSWASGHVEACGEYWLKPPTIQTSWRGMLITAATRADERTRATGSYDDADDGAEAIALDDESLVGTVPREPVATGPSNSQRAQDARAWSEALRAVRLDVNGSVVSAKGSKTQVSELSEAIAYSVVLAQVVGEGLGLDGRDRRRARRRFLSRRADAIQAPVPTGHDTPVPARPQ